MGRFQFATRPNEARSSNTPFAPRPTLHFRDTIAGGAPSRLLLFACLIALGLFVEPLFASLDAPVHSEARSLQLDEMASRTSSGVKEIFRIGSGPWKARSPFIFNSSVPLFLSSFSLPALTAAQRSCTEGRGKDDHR